MMYSTTWKKVCGCHGTATVPGFQFQQAMIGDGENFDRFKVTVTIHPGPCCDICGKPWKAIVKKK